MKDPSGIGVIFANVVRTMTEQPHELNRWRDRHDGHRAVAYELTSGGPLNVPGMSSVDLPGRTRRGLRCQACGEVIWLDEMRPEEPFTRRSWTSTVAERWLFARLGPLHYERSYANR